MKNETRRILRFLLLTFGITWTAWWLLALLVRLGVTASGQPLYILLHMIGGFGPTIAAVLLLPEKNGRAIRKFFFSIKKGDWPYLLLFMLLAALTVGLSSRESNPAIPWFMLFPIFLMTTLIGGGNEEGGWRGTLQPALERQLPYIPAVLITAVAWSLWHVPLWFIPGMGQQEAPFFGFVILSIFLSFWLGAIFKKTASVLACMMFHGFMNTLLSYFKLKLNWIFVAGLLLTLIISLLPPMRRAAERPAEAGSR